MWPAKQDPAALTITLPAGPKYSSFKKEKMGGTNQPVVHSYYESTCANSGSSLTGTVLSLPENDSL